MKMIKKNVSVIIPAYNEDKYIEETLNNLTFDWVKEIIVINDGSDDKTLQLIKNYQINVINFKKNRGKGRAVEAGLKEADADLIAIIDADLGKSVSEIVKLLNLIIKEDLDMVIGVINVKGGGLGFVRWLAKNTVSVFAGKKMEAPLSGQRILKRKILKDILPLTGGFGMEIGMNLDLLNNNCKVKEVKCDFTHRVTGHTLNGYLHRFRQFLDILKTIWYKRSYLWKRWSFLKN